MRTYSISRDGLRRLLWRSARTSFAVTALLIGIAVSLSLYGEERSNRTAGWILVYLVGVLIAGAWLSARATRRTWVSYRLEFSPETLRRTQHRVPEITIQRHEVSTIEEMEGRGLIVRTADTERFIFAPTALSDYQELRNELAGWAPVTKLSSATTWRRQWMGLGAALAIVAWMIATMLSRIAAFVIPSAFLISVFLLWAFVASQRSLHLDHRTKLSMWLVIFPILGLTLKSAYLIAGLGLIP